MAEQRVTPPMVHDASSGDFAASRDELVRLFQGEVRRETATQLAAGRIVYYCGTGDEAGKLFMHTPDGRRFEYRVYPDGTHEIVRELQR